MSKENISNTETEVTETKEATPDRLLGVTIERFKQIVASTTVDSLKRAKLIIEEELVNRQRQDVQKLRETFESLSPELQEIFLSSLKSSTLPKQEVEISTEKKVKAEKNPLRMYQDFPPDDPKYKIAPLVNVEANEVFTGGNPKNKAWLADLSSEERYEKFGTLKKLETEPDYLEVYMAVPKAVFQLVNGVWVDCAAK